MSKTAMLFSELPCLRSALLLTECGAKLGGASGSLFLSRKALSSCASCRFNPAHALGDLPLGTRTIPPFSLLGFDAITRHNLC